MTKSFEAKARIITGAASEEAKRWLDDKEFDSDAMFAVHEFARHLDQEAQEKPCDALLHGSEFDECVCKPKPEKPQQPEEIKLMDYELLLDGQIRFATHESLIQVIIKLNEIIRTLNKRSK